jgi:DNA-binding NtrC family response regulator
VDAKFRDGAHDGRFSEDLGLAEARSGENRVVNALVVRGASTAKQVLVAEARSALERVARSCTGFVLIEAERGIATEPVTAELHRRSPRAAHPCVGLRSAAELEFALARAGRGTLVIEDLAAFDAEAQIRLASRLFQRRIDGSSLECRLVTVLRASPDQLAASGTIREDLLHKLNGASLRLPPLRERLEELPARLLAAGATELCEEALSTLLAYAWPGNDRELELVLERALLLSAGARIETRHLNLAPESAAASNEALPLGDRSLRSLEKALIRRVLSEQSGNKSRSAAVLGLHRATLHQKLRDYQIDA